MCWLLVQDQRARASDNHQNSTGFHVITGSKQQCSTYKERAQLHTWIVSWGYQGRKENKPSGASETVRNRRTHFRLATGLEMKQQKISTDFKKSSMLLQWATTDRPEERRADRGMEICAYGLFINLIFLKVNTNTHTLPPAWFRGTRMNTVIKGKKLRQDDHKKEVSNLPSLLTHD